MPSPSPHFYPPPPFSYPTLSTIIIKKLSQLFHIDWNMLLFRNPRKFISGLQKRICRIFRPKIDASRKDIDQNYENTVLPRHRRRLPLELECEIFKFLKVEILQKFVCGMGRGIYGYGIFRQKLLSKTKRLCNPEENFWKHCNTKEKISCQSNEDLPWRPLIWSPDRLVTKREIRIGLSDGSIPEGSWVGMAPNSYACTVDHLAYRCRLSGTAYRFNPLRDWTKPKWDDYHENVSGCGLLLEPNGKIYTFFTVNGTLMETRLPISPSVDCLYPTFYQYMPSIVETNFGDDPTKPFNYDILKCPGMVFE